MDSNEKNITVKKLASWGQYQRLKKRRVVAQGWGDWTPYYNDKSKIESEAMPQHKQDGEACINALKHICREIKPGDLILAYDKTILKGICEMPDHFYFRHDPDEELSNTLYPVEWVDQEQVFPPQWDSIPGGQGPAGIVNMQYGKAKEVIKYWKIYKGKKQMEKLIKLVKTAYNVILTGAPGTGKTYLAQKIIAQKITENNTPGKEPYIEMTQFHPSYDYTDFIEGLRPCYKNKEADIGFELKKGIFMEFCDRAASDPNNKYVFIIDEINRGEIAKIFGEAFVAIDPGYRPKNKALPIKTQYHNLHQNSPEFETSNFKETFYVPENVYIIGTMNDIDRSVESFDFALRRRFTWKPIPAQGQEEIWAQEVLKDCAIANELKEKAIKCMTALNKALHNDPAPQFAVIYDIGPAYFRKLEIYSNEANPFEPLWNNHLEPLLNEYLREYPEETRKNKLAALKKAYDAI